MSITGCEESNIYIDSCVETLLVSSCINCTIFVALNKRNFAIFLHNEQIYEMFRNFKNTELF